MWNLDVIEDMEDMVDMKGIENMEVDMDSMIAQCNACNMTCTAGLCHSWANCTGTLQISDTICIKNKTIRSYVLWSYFWDENIPDDQDDKFWDPNIMGDNAMQFLWDQLVMGLRF